MSEQERPTCSLDHPSHPDRPSLTRPPALICMGHIRKLENNLRDIPDLHEQLADAHISWEQKIGYHSPGAEEVIPIDPNIAEYRAEMIERVGSWCRLLAKARSLHPPQPQNRPLTPDARMLQAMCSWLLIHVSWAVTDPEYATDMATAMAEVASKAWSLRYPNRMQQIELDDCINEVDGEKCLGTTFAMMRPKDELFPKYIACDTCDAMVESTDWYRYGLLVREAQGAAA